MKVSARADRADIAQFNRLEEDLAAVGIKIDQLHAKYNNFHAVVAGAKKQAAERAALRVEAQAESQDSEVRLPGKMMQRRNFTSHAYILCVHTHSFAVEICVRSVSPHLCALGSVLQPMVWPAGHV